MGQAGPRLITLNEYEQKTVPGLPHDLGELLRGTYGDYLTAAYPTPATGHEWQLTASSYVGHLPLSPDYHLVIQPKVPLQTLFGMLEYAYNLRSLEILPGLTHTASLQDFYERLADILARRVLDRTRRGLYRAYVPRADRLPYLRGRLDVAQALRQPGQPRLPCRYEDHTADIADNRILAWTLRQLAHGPLHRESVRAAVRRAHRALQGTIALTPIAPAECLGRAYNRLNDDYALLHALCHFLLMHSGPGHQHGSRQMTPFVVNMNQLFEKFVGVWLGAHLPAGYRLKSQEHVTLDAQNELTLIPDLIIYETATGQPRCVLDTKYKTQYYQADFNQVYTYASLKRCPEAYLIYPTASVAGLRGPLDRTVEGVRVRSLSFTLSGSLEEAGRTLLKKLAL